MKSCGVLLTSTSPPHGEAQNSPWAQKLGIVSDCALSISESEPMKAQSAAAATPVRKRGFICPCLSPRRAWRGRWFVSSPTMADRG